VRRVGYEWIGPARCSPSLEVQNVKLPGNMQSMMKQAQVMQQKLQEEIAQIRVEASAGGGMVTVKMDGQKHVLGVKIDPEVAGDVEMLQDMVLAAVNEAASRVDEESKSKMAGMLGGMGLPPGLF
jgi:nucleoid-associated protein EbfC